MGPGMFRVSREGVCSDIRIIHGCSSNSLVSLDILGGQGTVDGVLGPLDGQQEATSLVFSLKSFR